MKSLFKSDKREEALERLAIGITEASKNCTTVIKKINTLCQRPMDYPNPSELINIWIEHLFMNQFHDYIEDWLSPKTFSVEYESALKNSFFNYFASLIPFFYENKIIMSPELIKPKKYKWTTEDFKELKIKLLYKWFYKEWDNWDVETRLKYGYELDLKTKNVVEIIFASSKAKSKIWNRQRRIDEIVFSDVLKMEVKRIMPDYQYGFQKDLFLKYTDDFITRLPDVFSKFDDNFYEVGSYLYKYFQWS
jgi:hypothetical protein